MAQTMPAKRTSRTARRRCPHHQHHHRRTSVLLLPSPRNLPYEPWSGGLGVGSLQTIAVDYTCTCVWPCFKLLNSRKVSIKNTTSSIRVLIPGIISYGRVQCTVLNSIINILVPVNRKELPGPGTIVSTVLNSIKRMHTAHACINQTRAYSKKRLLL